MTVDSSRLRRRGLLKVISVVLGFIAAIIAYFVYLPMVEELKSMTEIIPAVVLRVLPVENWGILPYVVGAFYFFLVAMIVYWVSVLFMRIFAKKAPSMTVTRP